MQTRHQALVAADYPSQPEQPVVRWLFTRNGRALTCQVRTDGRGSSYEVAVVPHWDVDLSVVEQVETPVNALQRHAQIAMMLREAGWSVARRSA
jgi:hypothetical protein